LKVKKGDTIKVLSGKDRGKSGKVLSLIRDSGKIIVEKINIVKKHKKQTGETKDAGGIIEMEAPINVSKVMVVCPACSKPTRIGYEVKGGKKTRICKKCRGKL
jgi:large subunit ribosomal protein L24